MFNKFQKTFSLFELTISIALLSVLMLATLNTLMVAQRTETAQIRKTILAVEAKRAQNAIQRDIESSLFRSIDVVQRYIELELGPSDAIDTWSHCDDFTEGQVTTAFGTQFKRCNSLHPPVDGTPNCGWNFRQQGPNQDPTSDEYRFPNVHASRQYRYSKSGSIALTPSAVNVTLSNTGRVWAGVENQTTCPLDGQPLEYDKLPIKAVKMLTSRDRNGRRRTFMAGSKFGTPDWQGIIFYVSLREPRSSNSKLVRYTIYKDDLDLAPRLLDIGINEKWKNYEGYNGSQTDINGVPTPPAIKPPIDGDNTASNISGENEVLGDLVNFPIVPGINPEATNYTSIISGDPILPDSGPAVGIPSLMNLFDFNNNGDIECFPVQMRTADYNPNNITDLTSIFGIESSQEIFRVRIGPIGEIPSGHPFLEWSKEKKIGGIVVREFYIRIDLKTHEVFWYHNFQGNGDEGGIQILNWDRYRSFVRQPEVIANYVVQWEMTTSRSTQEFWRTTDFDVFPPVPSTPIPFFGTSIGITSEVQTDNLYAPNLDLLRIAMDNYVRVTLVFDRPYLDAGELKHEELVIGTGFASR